MTWGWMAQKKAGNDLGDPRGQLGGWQNLTSTAKVHRLVGPATREPRGKRHTLAEQSASTDLFLCHKPVLKMAVT